MSNKRPSITRKPVEGPLRELLRWYGYDIDLSLEDEFLGTHNDTTDNDSTSVYLSFQHLFDFVLGFWIDFVKFSASVYLITYCVMFLRVRYLSMDLNVIYFADVANKMMKVTTVLVDLRWWCRGDRDGDGGVDVVVARCRWRW
ncbi:hypothetical protein Tco_1227723 [Tanacetum coccineum]